MTQPRRRRRRRRGGGQGAGQGEEDRTADAPVVPRDGAGGGSARKTERDGSENRSSGRSRRGRRRGKARRESRETSETVSSEDLVRAPPRRPPRTLSRPPDGITLEQVIGELQSDWGVPQHPQEFRITLRVADERARSGGPTTVEELREERPAEPDAGSATPAVAPHVKREKAPAAPRVEAVGSGEDASAGRSRKRRRSRKRKRGSRS
jgi:hypothetical protein